MKIFVIGVLLSVALLPVWAQDKPDAQKLSDVETMKLQLAQKDLVIAQLQKQIVQLSSQVLQSVEADAQSKMAAAKDEVTKAHAGEVVQFKPDGSPFLVDNPLKAPEIKPNPK